MKLVVTQSPVVLYADTVRVEGGRNLGTIHTYDDGKRRFWPQSIGMTAEELHALAELLSRLGKE